MMCGVPFFAFTKAARTCGNVCRKRKQRHGQQVPVPSTLLQDHPIVVEPRNAYTPVKIPRSQTARRAILDEIRSSIGKPKEVQAVIIPPELGTQKARGGVLKPFKGKRSSFKPKKKQKGFKQLRPRKRA